MLSAAVKETVAKKKQKKPPQTKPLKDQHKKSKKIHILVMRRATDWRNRHCASGQLRPLHLRRAAEMGSKLRVKPPSRTAAPLRRSPLGGVTNLISPRERGSVNSLEEVTTTITTTAKTPNRQDKDLFALVIQDRRLNKCNFFCC